jgi:uncharacterized damage-inducible protein DinB
MKTTDFIAQHIVEVFEGGNWTEVNFKSTLKDINYKEATTVTKASYNTIAALLYHTCFYNEVVLQRLQGINPAINEKNGFDLPPVRNENDWNELKRRCFQSAHALAEAVKKFPEERLSELTITGHSTHYKTLHGVAEHTHYHLGQIVILNKLIKNQVHQYALSSSL